MRRGPSRSQAAWVHPCRHCGAQRRAALTAAGASLSIFPRKGSGGGVPGDDSQGRPGPRAPRMPLGSGTGVWWPNWPRSAGDRSTHCPRATPNSRGRKQTPVLPPSPGLPQKAMGVGPRAARGNSQGRRERPAGRREPGAHRGPWPAWGRLAAPAVVGERATLAEARAGGWGWGGKGRLTSWEISRCFLAKVRACAGLPMDT